MASSSSSTVPSSEQTSYFTSQTEMEMEMESSSTVPSSEQSSYFISQTEMEMESAKASHWSQVDYSTTHSEWSAETNFKDFALLKENPRWGRFFKDFEALEVGEKISEGAQADIYEARNKHDGPYNLVVKVMKGDAPLQAFQAQWPIGMLSTSSLITILGGTVLHDERLRGRFAFVMFRRWGDLRFLIDRRIEQERSTRGPFSIDEAIHLMLRIAEDMQTLHDKHDIIHRDLKASNVLVWGGIGKDISIIPPLGQVEWIGSLVTDFECSVGVLGTKFWRAPEILEQHKAKVPSAKVEFTRASDVYSYGMVCYEIVTGIIPYDGLEGEDMIFQILQGRRPELPHDLPEFVRIIIVGCWHSNPLERPSFLDICEVLMRKRGPYFESVVIDNESKRGANIVKVEQWNNLQALTLLEVMQKLMDMDLSILKASHSSSAIMILHYFEVTNYKGKKVMNDKSTAYIREVLKSLNCQLLDKKESSDAKTLKTKSISTLAPRHEDVRIVKDVTVEDVSMEFVFGEDVTVEDVTVQGMWWNDENVIDGMYIDQNINKQSHVLDDEDIFGNSTMQMYVLEVISERSAYLLEDLSRLLVAMNFQIHSAGCWTREGRVECIVYVKGARMGSFLWELRHNMEYFPISLGCFKVIVHRVAVEELFHLNKRLHDLKFMDLTCPRNSSNLCVHQRMELREDVQSSQVVICLEKRWLVDVSRNLTDMGYKIVQASVGPNEFLKDQGNKREEICIETLGEDEPENMIYRIFDIATERGCSKINTQLIVYGPTKILLQDLMRSLSKNDLIATDGEVYCEVQKFGIEKFFPTRFLDFFGIKESFPTRFLDFFGMKESFPIRFLEFFGIRESFPTRSLEFFVTK